MSELNSPGGIRSIEGLEAVGVKYVRLTWVDFINFTRYRVIPIHHFKRLVNSAPVTVGGNGHGQNLIKRNGIMITKVCFGLVYITMAEGFSPSGEYMYVPDLSSARMLAHVPGHVSIMGWFEEKAPIINSRSEKTLQAEFCPRTTLHNLVDKARTKNNLEFLIGFETEVIFLKSTKPMTAANDYGWSESAALAAGSPEASACEEIAEALAAANIDLQMYHAEAAPGQFEFVTGPLTPLESCDALVITRDIIMNIAHKHGFRATLAPRIYTNNCGSSSHAHFSVRPCNASQPAQAQRASGNGAKVEPPLTNIEATFLASLLAHLPAVCAFTLPTAASYARMLDGIWSGGTWSSWGRDNRESPIRLCGNGAGRNANDSTSGYHFELRCLDGTASPYLAMIAMLSAGLLGFDPKNASPLSAPVEDAPSSLPSAQRQELGITTRLPLNIKEARTALLNDTAMREVLGEEFVKVYLTVNECLEQQMHRENPEDAMLRLIQTY